MNDRFDFLELGDTPPKPLPEAETPATNGSGWKPLRLRVVEVIGDPGTAAGQFSAPLGLTVDPWGALYVTDANNHRIQRITPGGDVRLYGRPGNASGQLWGPQDVAVDPTGQFFFVADQGNHRIQCFRMINGQHWGFISDFRSPSGVAFDAQGMLWIADTGNARVLRCDVRSGQFFQPILDHTYGVGRPIAVACDAAHTVYVTDGVTGDVARYAYDGRRLGSLGAHRKLGMPRQVVVDAEQRIYMAEAGANRLHVYDVHGNSIATFENHSRLGPLRSPAGVALGPTGEIYLSDTLNHRVLRLAWE